MTKKHQNEDQQASNSEAVATNESDSLSEDATTDSAETTASEVTDSDSANDATEDFEAQLEALQEQLNLANEKAIRLHAEMDNLRKRSERDIANAHKYGNEQLLRSLIPLLDGLENGRKSIQPKNTDDTAIIDGFNLIEKQFLKVMTEAGVELVVPEVASDFDANLHQAMTTVANTEMAANKIVEVYQKGFVLNGRLIRPALVVVSSGA